jgi:OPT oligopeptide transporter protein
MLVAIGMYLPFGTTAAMFVGGLIRWTADRAALRRGFNEAQRARVENSGVLTASGLIAGEAILGLVWAGLQFAPPNIREHLQLFPNPSYWIGLAVLAILAFIIVRAPLSSAGSPDEPAPPVAMM